MDKIKQFLADQWTKVALVVGGLITILLYILDLRNKKVAALQSQVDLVDTQKKADVLETQIKVSMDDANNKQKDIDAHQQVLSQLDQKRKDIEKAQQNTTPQQNVDYWNKQ